MEIQMDPLQKQMLDDVFDAFTMLVKGGIVTLMHVDGGFTRYSASAVELFGLPGEYIPNGAMDWNDHLHPEDRRRYMEVMLPLLEGKTQSYDLTYRVLTQTGDYVSFRAIGAVLRGNDGKPSLIGGAMLNEKQMDSVDPVTVLPNRNAFLKDLRQLAEEEKNLIALQVGIRKFSEINRVHGYTYGNQILQACAWTIQEIVKGRGRVYRLNGAAFAILFETLRRDEAAAVYDMIRYRMQSGVEINGNQNTLMTSGGMISTFGKNATADTVFSCLDYACAESKKQGRGELVDFNGSINDEGVNRLRLLNAIRNSVENDCEGFVMQYVPVVDVNTGEIKGAEAVVCWESEETGRVESEDFLPVLERDFLFEELSDFILHKSLSDGKKLLEKDPNFLLCLNVYRAQLESTYFFEDFMQAVKESGFPVNQLSLKLDALCRLLDMDHLRDLVERLHREGVLVIIDGFGSGTDSIVFLKNVAVDAVCLDSRFTQGVEKPGRDRDIMEYLTRMAATCVHHINIKGVDSEEVLTVVRSLPVTTVQGSYFAQPLSLDTLLERYETA